MEAHRAVGNLRTRNEEAAIVNRPLTLTGSHFGEQKSTWWKAAVVYQVYMASFKDTNHDGYGDLAGIAENLDYLVDLGVDVLWLSPIFDSPMYDMGYDIADYYKINPVFGDMADFDRLLAQAHGKGLRVILDIAFNHTSNEHGWFKKSMAAAKREGHHQYFKDFYIWGDPTVDPTVDQDANGHPPTNWESVFGGSMWEWVPDFGKYYLHVFGKAQPDLKWENGAVRNEVWNVLRFWLDKGMDGFRLDAINCLSKARNHDLCAGRPGQPTVSGWPDAPVFTPGRFEQRCNEMFANGPRIHEYLHEMHQRVFAHYDAVSLGEMSCGITPGVGRTFVGRSGKERQLDLILHFEHVELDCVGGDKWVPRDWELSELKAAVSKWQTCMAEAGGWDTIWMENHDQPRGVSRFCKGDETSWKQAAKLLCLWMLTLQGTVIVFQGQELGMSNPDEFSEDMIKDVETRLFWNATHQDLARGAGVKKLEMAKKAITSKGRDASRIPIPTSGGFTGSGAKPWLPEHKHFSELCAESQRHDPASVWSLYRDMIRIRKECPGLVSVVTTGKQRNNRRLIIVLAWQIYGAYHAVDQHHASIFAYTRTFEGDVYLIVLNFGSQDVEWEMPPTDGRAWVRVKSTRDDQAGESTTLRLGPYGGVICKRER
ncbi:alpha-glucosidase 1 [Rhypophila sp. PSN 637]